MADRDELIESFTQHEVETAESILRCMQQPTTADKFRRMVLLFLRGHYSSPDNYMGFDHLSCYFWHPEPIERRLEVEFTHQDDDRNPDAYPGVYVGFGGVTLDRGGLGGNFGGNSQDLAGTSVSKVSMCRLLVHHVAKTASDGYDLADLSARALTAMAAPLAMNSGATGFEVLGYAEPKEKNPSPEKYYTVAMPVEIQYTLGVNRSLESHRIRRITQAIDFET